MSVVQEVEPLQPRAFGAATAGEGRLRAAAGGLLSTGLVVGGFCAAGFGGSVLLPVAAAGAAGSALSWRWERSRPSSCPEARYAAVGAVVALAALLLLGLGDLAFLLLGATVALPAGVTGGAVGGLVASRAPGRSLLLVAGLGVAVLVGSGVVAAARALPVPPGSYVVVEGPSDAGSAEQLAAKVAAGLRAQPDPASDAAWERVAATAVDPLPDGRVGFGHAGGGGGRSITVLVEGDRACVEVRGGRVESHAGGCRAT